MPDFSELIHLFSAQFWLHILKFHISDPRGSEMPIHLWAHNFTWPWPSSIHVILASWFGGRKCLWSTFAPNHAGSTNFLELKFSTYIQALAPYNRMAMSSPESVWWNFLARWIEKIHISAEAHFQQWCWNLFFSRLKIFTEAYLWEMVLKYPFLAGWKFSVRQLLWNFSDLWSFVIKKYVYYTIKNYYKQLLII